MLEIICYLQFVPLMLMTLLLGLTYGYKELRPSEDIVRLIMKWTGILSFIVTIYSLTILNTNLDVLLFDIIKIKYSVLNSLIYLATIVILGIVNKFSIKYIHKEIGFYKFFLNIAVFWVGLFLFIFSGENLVTFAGWELIGISSIFLISFYSYRKSPVNSSLYVVSFYKFADICLITGILFISHESMLGLNANYFSYVYVMIVIAGLIKSASFPFTSWLPRSMEGPTSSSAIYYTALSINTGVLLIVKFLPEILQYDLSRNVLIFSGVFTILYSSMQSRVQNDIKSSLGYSASVQIGFVLLELAFNFPVLALCHLYLSSFLKIYQFMRTPSLFHLYHTMEGEYGKAFTKTGAHFEFLIPKLIRKKLYYLTLNHFYIDAFYLIIRKVLKKLGALSKLILHPLVEGPFTVSYRSMMWWIYFVIVVILIGNNVFEINANYFEIIPILILFISIGLLFEKKVGTFISFFSIYKILEAFIVHGVHTHEPFRWLGVLIVGVFSFVIIFHEKIKSEKYKYLVACITVFLMLYFTNFPFLHQSLVNEHIIDAFISNNHFEELIFYCLANTFLNIGLYNFVFYNMYIVKAEDNKQ